MASETLGSRKTFLVSDNPFSNSKIADFSSSVALVSFIGKHSKGDVRTTSRLKNEIQYFDFAMLIVVISQ